VKFEKLIKKIEKLIDAIKFLQKEISDSKKLPYGQFLMFGPGPSVGGIINFDLLLADWNTELAVSQTDQRILEFYEEGVTGFL